MNSPRGPASALLVAYYAFLLLGTALAYGQPYPFFGLMLGGLPARAAVLLDCLVLVHIVLGAWRAQRLTWYLLLGYNVFNLASLGLSLALLSPQELTPLAGDPASLPAFYTGVAVSAAVLLAVTAHAWRLRSRFEDPDPFLF